MNILKSFITMLCPIMLLCGFSWGSDPCKEAQEQAQSLNKLKDEGKIRQAEANILSICPDGAAAHYIAAIQLERVGNVDGAIGEYRKALQKSPFALASGNLGLLYAQKGMNDEASVELSKGLASVSDPRYHKALGLILTERKVYPLATYHLNEAGRELTKEADVFIALAEIQAAQGQPDKALAEYRRALTADPNNEKAYLGIARVHLGRNEQDKALESLKKAEVANSRNREVHLMMADIYEKKGDAKAAEYQYLLGGKPKVKTASAQAPVAPAQGATAVSIPVDSKDEQALKAMIKESPERAADAYEKLGNLYRAAGRDAEAIAAYQEAAYRKSTSSAVYLNLGILHEKGGKLDEAVVDYKQAVRVNHDDADAHLRLAELRNARGFNQDAVEQYTEFLRLRPESPDIQLKLARIFGKTKEYNLAISAYSAVLKHSPDNADANREIAQIYKTKGMNDKAVEHYIKAIAQQKDDQESRNALIAMYVKNKQYDEITALLKEAAELFPDDANNHYKLGLIYEFRKDYDNAVAAYKKTSELKPDHARALNALGRLYMKTGKISEAKEALEAAKRIDPSLEEASVLLNNVRDEFNPEPRKISSKLKGKKSKKSKKSSKKSKSSKTKKSGKKTKKQ